MKNHLSETFDNLSPLEVEVLLVKNDIDAQAETFMKIIEEQFAQCFQDEINFNAASRVPDDMHMVIQTVLGYARPGN